MGSKVASETMPTLRTGLRNQQDDGFTLVEVVVTLFILGLMVSLGISTFLRQQARTISHHTTIIANYLDLVRERAHLRHQIHRVYWNLDQQEATCVMLLPNGTERPIQDAYIPATWRWPSTIQLRDVWTSTDGRTQTGQRRTTVSTMGHLQPTTVHFVSTSPNSSAITTLLIRTTTSAPEVLYGDILYPPQL